MFADEEGVEACAAKFLKIGVGAEAGFGDGEAVIGDVFDQLERSFHTHGEGFQVTIVYAEDAGLGGQSAVELCAGVNFDEGLHGEFAAEGEEVAQKRIVERRDDKQEAVRIVGASLPNLPGIEDEILAQGGESDSLCVRRGDS